MLSHDKLVARARPREYWRVPPLVLIVCYHCALVLHVPVEREHILVPEVTPPCDSVLVVLLNP